MKKQGIILITLVLLTFQSISQTYDSVTCIPNGQLKKAINLIERGKVAEEELGITKDKNAILSKVVIVKDSIITVYQKKDTINALMQDGYRSAVKNLQTSLANAEAKYHIQNVRLLRQKIKKWGSFVVGIGVGFLIFH